MTAPVRSQLAALAGAIADLKERVRVAVAGELGRAIGGAVQQVVQALVTGRANPPPETAPPRHAAPRPGWDDEEEDALWGSGRDPWSYDRDDGYDDRGRHAAPVSSDAPPAPAAGLTTAVARTAVAVVAAAADILGAADALGAGAARLDPP